jgi:biopolymer transport protein ExbD
MILLPHRAFSLVAGCLIVLALALILFEIVTDVAPEPPIEDDVVTVTGDGRILFRGNVVPLERLQATMQAAGVSTPVLRAEEGVSYEFAVDVLDILRQEQSGVSLLLDAPGPGYHEQRERFSPATLKR